MTALRARIPLLFATALLLLAWPVLCGAQSRENMRKLSAEALFDQGLRLMDAGDFAAACPKLDESQRLDPGIGTLLYLGECYMSLGKTASAWMSFREAAFQARRSGETEREATAVRHADELRQRLSFLVIELDEPPTGTRIELDGQELSMHLLDTPFPVDPGDHTLVVSAPGRHPWRQSLGVKPDAASQRVRVPRLPVAPHPAAPRPPELEPPRSGSWHTVGWIAVGTGAVALGGAALLFAADAHDATGPVVLAALGTVSVGSGLVLVTRSANDAAGGPLQGPTTAMVLYRGEF